MKSIHEIIALFRYANACRCVKYSLWQLDRERRALAKAYDACDRARADLRAFEVEGNTEPEIPVYLQKGKK